MAPPNELLRHSLDPHRVRKSWEAAWAEQNHNQGRGVPDCAPCWHPCAGAVGEGRVLQLCHVGHVRCAVDTLVLLAEQLTDARSTEAVLELMFSLTPFVDFSA